MVQKTGVAAKKRAAALVGVVRERKATASRAFYEMGVALKELHDRKLYGALGYETFPAMLRGEALVGKTFAFELIAVVLTFTLPEATRQGFQKSKALVRYARATAAPDDPAALARSRVKVGGRARPTAELSARAIERQAKVVRQSPWPLM